MTAAAPQAAVRDALADARPVPCWLDSPLRPQRAAALGGATSADLVAGRPRRRARRCAPTRSRSRAARACVRLHEDTPATGLARTATGVRIRTRHGRVEARRAVLATDAFPSLLRRLRPFTVPVPDDAVMTEPLDAQRRASLGWAHRQGIGDGGNLFHHYRLTDDDRVLSGGYDAVSSWRGRVDPRHDTRPQAARLLGCTGLGVGASRFAAAAALDLLAGRPTERTRTPLVTSRPLPFPPGPVRWAGITLTRRSLARRSLARRSLARRSLARRSLARADARDGHRDLWLRTLDRLGLGFDS